MDVRVTSAEARSPTREAGPRRLREPANLILDPDDRQDPCHAAERVARLAYRLADSRDVDGIVPDQEIALLASQGLLHAPLPQSLGGASLGLTANTALTLRDVLRTIGGASLALGRLYEGHVNSIKLVARFGTEDQVAILVREAGAGRLSAVWNAQTGPGLCYDGRSLSGSKIYCSGIGLVHRPLLTASGPDGVVMLIPDVSAAVGDLSGWTPLGMRASLTGRADFTGIEVAAHECVGSPGDYYTAPAFSAGAWRVMAVQLGGLERLVTLYRTEMGNRGRSGDPVQRARFGQTAAVLETARLWVSRSAIVAEGPDLDPSEAEAVVNLSRWAFEQAALAIIERVERGVGLQAMLRPNPIERIIRDLKTYLRQPFPDAALDAAALWTLQDRPMHLNLGDA